MPQDYGSGSPNSASTRSAAGEELSRDASQLKDTAGQRIEQEADTRKGQAAQIAGSASSALSKAASELEQDDNAPDWLGSAMRHAASSIDRLAGEIDGRSVNQMGQQLMNFARSNPGTFLAASAATGFAAARMLRAGVEHRHHKQDSSGSSEASGSYGASTMPGSGAASSGVSTGTGVGPSSGTSTGSTTGASTAGFGADTISPASTRGGVL